jgi:hypothetical protein
MKTFQHNLARLPRLNLSFFIGLGCIGSGVSLSARFLLNEMDMTYLQRLTQGSCGANRE